MFLLTDINRKNNNVIILFKLYILSFGIYNYNFFLNLTNTNHKKYIYK